MNHTDASLAQRRANAQKMYTKKRNAEMCQRGHNNWGFRKDGRRYCITCKVNRTKEWRKNYKPRKPLVAKRDTELVVVRRLTFEERQALRQKVSDIQREREFRVRRMHVLTTYKTKLYLGGSSRPFDEQVRCGYPDSTRKRAA